MSSAPLAPLAGHLRNTHPLEKFVQFFGFMCWQGFQQTPGLTEMDTECLGSETPKEMRGSKGEILAMITSWDYACVYNVYIYICIHILYIYINKTKYIYIYETLCIYVYNQQPPWSLVESLVCHHHPIEASKWSHPHWFQTLIRFTWSSPSTKLVNMVTNGD